MRVTIYPGDNVIFIDGKGKAFNGQSLREKRVKVIRWSDKTGEVEYVTGAKQGIGSLDKQQLDGWSIDNLIAIAKDF